MFLQKAGYLYIIFNIISYKEKEFKSIVSSKWKPWFIQASICLISQYWAAAYDI